MGNADTVDSIYQVVGSYKTFRNSVPTHLSPTQPLDSFAVVYVVLLLVRNVFLRADPFACVASSTSKSMHPTLVLLLAVPFHETSPLISLSIVPFHAFSALTPRSLGTATARASRITVSFMTRSSSVVALKLGLALTYDKKTKVSVFRKVYD